MSARTDRIMTVLVVDDNAPLRRSIRRLLEADGFAVLEADRARDAAAVCEAAGRQVDLLIADLLMPGMDGFELGRQLLDSKLVGRFIIVSGDVDRANDDERASTATAIVRKPFDGESLIEVVRAAIAGPPPATR
jgi:DNA-binding response OmpR family regulator